MLNRVPEQENLFIFNAANLPKCFESYRLPTCDCTEQEGDKYCSATDFHLDQSNLLKSNLSCLGPEQHEIAIEDNHLDISVLVQVNISFDSSTASDTVVSWPTPVNKITEEQATTQCNTVLSSSNYQSVCGNQSDIDTKALLTGCVKDIQVVQFIQTMLKPYLIYYLVIFCHIVSCLI